MCRWHVTQTPLTSLAIPAINQSVNQSVNQITITNTLWVHTATRVSYYLVIETSSEQLCFDGLVVNGRDL